MPTYAAHEKDTAPTNPPEMRKTRCFEAGRRRGRLRAFKSRRQRQGSVQADTHAQQAEAAETGVRAGVQEGAGGRVLETAPVGTVLEGTVRARVLAAAAAGGLGVREAAPDPRQRREWREAFVCNALRDLQPVERICCAAGTRALWLVCARAVAARLCTCSGSSARVLWLVFARAVARLRACSGSSVRLQVCVFSVWLLFALLRMRAARSACGSGHLQRAL